MIRTGHGVEGSSTSFKVDFFLGHPVVGINLWNHFHVSGNPAEEPNESADGQAVFEPPVDHGDLEISRSRYHRYILGDLWRRQHLCQRHLPSNQGPETRDHVSCEQHL